LGIIINGVSLRGIGYPCWNGFVIEFYLVETVSAKPTKVPILPDKEARGNVDKLGYVGFVQWRNAIYGIEFNFQWVLLFLGMPIDRFSTKNFIKTARQSTVMRIQSKGMLGEGSGWIGGGYIMFD
jgi:hypothetical protein